MGMSRSSRIILLLVIDSLFFFLEIIVGYAVHSLALVADSFHMVDTPPPSLGQSPARPTADGA